MIEKCPECNEKIDALVDQPVETGNTTGLFTMVTMTTAYSDVLHAATGKTYKCSNPKCWASKINESWE